MENFRPITKYSITSNNDPYMWPRDLELAILMRDKDLIQHLINSFHASVVDILQCFCISVERNPFGRKTAAVKFTFLFHSSSNKIVRMAHFC